MSIRTNAQCSARLHNGIRCSEINNFQIFDEINTIFQAHLSRKNVPFQEKEQIYCHWITELMEENTSLVAIIDRIEREITKSLMEIKFQFSNYIASLENDLKNMLILFQRSNVDRHLATGLTFHNIRAEDIFGTDAALSLHPIRQSKNRLDFASPEKCSVQVSIKKHCTCTKCQTHSPLK